MKDKISVVVVNYNGKKWLKKCLGSIQDQSYKKFEIIVVDNGSADNSSEYIKKNFPSVKLIETVNNGYGAACNLGAQQATGEFLMFFNEDMYVDQDFLFNYINFYHMLPNKESVGTIGCRIDHYDKRPYYKLPVYGYSIDLLGIPSVNTHPNRIFSNSGCPLFIKREVFLKVRGFCQNIFLYYEDVDICWRLNLFGYKHYFANNISIYHFGGGVIGGFSPKKISYYIQGEVNTLLNNYSKGLLFIVIPLYLVYYIMLAGLYLFTGKFTYIKAIVSNLIRLFITDRDKILKFRGFVQRKRKASDLEILSKVSMIPSRLRNLL